MLNGESKKVMVIMRDGRFLTVCVNGIKGDGNCLFGASVHQLYFTKIDSKEHNELVAGLRKKVVDHIHSHFERFKIVIKSREEIQIKTDKKDESDKACMALLDCLAKPCFWGGTESILAIGEIFKANIVIFLERDQYYFPNGFKANYDRSIFLAYRGSQISKTDKTIKYNHYESVCDISQDLLYKCACDLSKFTLT